MKKATKKLSTLFVVLVACFSFTPFFVNKGDPMANPVGHIFRG